MGKPFMTKEEKPQKRVQEIILSLELVELVEFLEGDIDSRCFRVIKRKRGRSRRLFPT
jgi:hypothetical protein